MQNHKRDNTNLQNINKMLYFSIVYVTHIT